MEQTTKCEKIYPRENVTKGLMRENLAARKYLRSPKGPKEKRSEKSHRILSWILLILPLHFSKFVPFFANSKTFVISFESLHFLPFST